MHKAAEATNGIDKLKFLALGSMRGYICAMQRSYKCFNPILGETFEYVDETQGIKILMEQTGHHPMTDALLLETPKLKLQTNSMAIFKFTGNSIEVTSPGSVRFLLKNTGELFQLTRPKVIAHNIIVGHMWREVTGVTEIVNLATKEKIVFNWKRSGLLGAGYKQIQATIFDAKGTAQTALFGSWGDTIYERKLNPDEDLSKQLSNLKIASGTDQAVFKYDQELGQDDWKPIEPPANQFVKGWSKIMYKLVAMDHFTKRVVAESDSRLRPDRQALLEGNVKEAAERKQELEEAQRKKKGEPVVNKYFKPTKDQYGEFWDYTGGFWEERAERIKQYLQKHGSNPELAEHAKRAELQLNL